MISSTSSETTAPLSGSVDEASAAPRTTTVLGLLALTSLTFSYLGAYAVSGALVQTEVVKRWQPDADPRPKWLAIGFCVLLTCFTSIGGLVRFLSRRQLQQIDEMGEESPEIRKV